MIILYLFGLILCAVIEITLFIVQFLKKSSHKKNGRTELAEKIDFENLKQEMLC